MLNDHIKLVQQEADQCEATFALKEAHSYLRKRLTMFKEECLSCLHMQDATADDVATAALRAFGAGQHEEARSVVRLLESKDAVKVWLQSALENALGLAPGGLDED